MDNNKNQSPASKALSEVLNTVRENTNILKNCVNVLCENNKLLRAIYNQKSNIQPHRPVEPLRFTIKNMTDTQLKDLISQGLSFEFIYFISNRKFSIDYIKQTAQKMK